MHLLKAAHKKKSTAKESASGKCGELKGMVC